MDNLIETNNGNISGIINSLNTPKGKFVNRFFSKRNLKALANDSDAAHYLLTVISGIQPNNESVSEETLKERQANYIFLIVTEQINSPDLSGYKTNSDFPTDVMSNVIYGLNLLSRLNLEGFQKQMINETFNHYNESAKYEYHKILKLPENGSYVVMHKC